ncbi:MAG: DUF1922 domain-containing protein [Promethearchaeota archaeon]
MGYKEKFTFFRCYHCGEWFYTKKPIKVKKCWKCNRIFQFKNAFKFSKTCQQEEAIRLIKMLKEKEKSKYETNHTSFYQFKLNFSK